MTVHRFSVSVLAGKHNMEVKDDESERRLRMARSLSLGDFIKLSLKLTQLRFFCRVGMRVRG